MSIMEKDLPVAESINEGDKVRIVTSQGNSKQVDASQIGGGSMKLISSTQEGAGRVLNKTYNEIYSAMENGIIPFFVAEMAFEGATATHIIFNVALIYAPTTSEDFPNAGYYCTISDAMYYSETPDGILVANEGGES